MMQLHLAKGHLAPRRRRSADIRADQTGNLHLECRARSSLSCNYFRHLLGSWSCKGCFFVGALASEIVSGAAPVSSRPIRDAPTLPSRCFTLLLTPTINTTVSSR